MLLFYGRPPITPTSGHNGNLSLGKGPSLLPRFILKKFKIWGREVNDSEVSLGCCSTIPKKESIKDKQDANQEKKITLASILTGHM